MKINKQKQLILVIFLIGILFILLNGSTMAFCAFENSKQWLAPLDPVLFINKCGDILEALTWKTGKVVLSGSVAYMAIKLAEFGWNVPYLVCSRMYHSPLGTIEQQAQIVIAWVFGKKEEDGWLKKYVESTEYTYLLPTVWNIVTPQRMHYPTTYSASLAVKAKDIQPITNLNIPVVQVNSSANITTSTDSQLITQPHKKKLELVKLEHIEIKPEPQPEPKEIIVYKDRENVAEFKKYLLSLRKDIRESKDAQIDAFLGRQNLQAELVNLNFFNTKEGFNPNLYQNNKAIRRSFDLEDISLVLPQMSRIEFRFEPEISNSFSARIFNPMATGLTGYRSKIIICFSKTSFQLVMEPSKFEEHFPSILNILTQSFTKNEQLTHFSHNPAVLEIKYKTETGSSWFKKATIDSENCMFYFLNQNDTPMPFLKKAYLINTERAGISNSKLDSTRLLIENFILNSTFSDFEVFLAKEFGSVAVRQEIKSFLGAFENQRLKTIMPNNIVEIPVVLERLAKEEGLKRQNDINKIRQMRKELREARQTTRVQEQTSITETQTALDLASPLVLGSLGLGGALTQLVAVLNGTPILENPDTINLLTTLYNHANLPLPEVLRTLQPVTEIVQNNTLPEIGVSTTTINASSISSVSVPLTETFSTYIPSLKSVAIGVSIVGVVACTVYAMKYGVGVNATDVKEAATAVISEDYSKYLKIDKIE